MALPAIWILGGGGVVVAMLAKFMKGSTGAGAVTSGQPQPKLPAGVTITDGGFDANRGLTVDEIKAADALAALDCRRRGGRWSPGAGLALMGSCTGDFIHGDLGIGNIFTTGVVVPTAGAVKADAAGQSDPAVDHFRAVCAAQGKTIAWRSGKPVGCR